MGLDDEEPHDQGAEDHQLGMGHARCRNLDAKQPQEGRQKLVEHDGQHHDEGRAKERTHDGAQPADDHHEQQAERHFHRERGRLPRTQVHKGPQRAGHAHDEGADGEGAELGVHGADANHGGGHVHVADSHPLAANRTAHQVLGQQGHHYQNSQAEHVLAGGAVNRHAQHLQVGHRHRARVGVVGEPLDAQEHPVAEELRGQRGHGQVQALHAQAGQPEQNAEERGAQPAQDECRNQRHAGEAHKEVVSPIGPHGHEGARAQRDLPAVAHQDVHPQGGQRHDDEGNQDGAEDVVAGKRRHHQEGHREDEPDGNAVLRNGEDLLVSAVAGLELAVFAVEHGVSPVVLVVG